MTDSQSHQFEERLRYRFTRPALLRQALTHCSATARHGPHNETLEFLGDAVVGLVVSDLLLSIFPEADEGQLSVRRAALVNAQSLAACAMRLDLGAVIDLGRGEEKTGGRRKTSILAGAFEALIGAVYRDGGFAAARDVVAHVLQAEIASPLAEAPDAATADHKTRLQELTQRLYRAAPAYRALRTTGPDHAPGFESSVEVGGRILGRGQGASKKQADQAAAQEALRRLAEDQTSEGKEPS